MENYEKKLDALCGLSILFGGLLVIASMLFSATIVVEYYNKPQEELRGTYEEHLEEDAQQVVEAIFNICGFRY